MDHIFNTTSGHVRLCSLVYYTLTSLTCIKIYIKFLQHKIKRKYHLGYQSDDRLIELSFAASLASIACLRELRLNGEQPPFSLLVCCLVLVLLLVSNFIMRNYGYTFWDLGHLYIVTHLNGFSIRPLKICVTKTSPKIIWMSSFLQCCIVT